MVGLGFRMGISAAMTTVLVVNNNPERCFGFGTYLVMSSRRQLVFDNGAILYSDASCGSENEQVSCCVE
eukprot:s7240_g6.t1